MSARIGRILVFRSSPAVGSRDTSSRSGPLKRSHLQESAPDPVKSRAYFWRKASRICPFRVEKEPRSERHAFADQTSEVLETADVYSGGDQRAACHPNLLAEKEIAMKLRTACAALVLVASMLMTGCCCHRWCCRPRCCSPCATSCYYAPPAACPCDGR